MRSWFTLLNLNWTYKFYNCPHSTPTLLSNWKSWNNPTLFLLAYSLMTTNTLLHSQFSAGGEPWTWGPCCPWLLLDILTILSQQWKNLLERWLLLRVPIFLCRTHTWPKVIAPYTVVVVAIILSYYICISMHAHTHTHMHTR